VVREGLEALLVIAALAVYLTKAGARDRLPALYGGAGLAVVASVAAAWVFEQFYGGAHDDTIEAVIILVAAALMLYVSGWLLVRQDPRAWQRYLQRRADQALAQRTVLAVAALAFFAVFREGAETVLFIHALATTTGGWTVSLFAGLAAAAIILLVAFVALRALALRLPLRAVFLATSCFLFAMAVKFVGEAVQEFQEQQIIPYDGLDGLAWLSAIGVSPSLQGLAAQAGVIAVSILSYFVLMRRARRTLQTASAT
jgi:high-affinity iron transporter